MTPDGAQINSNMVFQSRIGIIAQGLLQVDVNSFTQQFTLTYFVLNLVASIDFVGVFNGI